MCILILASPSWFSIGMLLSRQLENLYRGHRWDLGHHWSPLQQRGVPVLVPYQPCGCQQYHHKDGRNCGLAEQLTIFGIQEYWGVGFRHLCPTRMEVIWECSSVEKNTTARGSDSKFASLCVGRSEYTEQQDFDTHQSFEVVAQPHFRACSVCCTKFCSTKVW